jgi:hypothetical protein
LGSNTTRKKKASKTNSGKEATSDEDKVLTENDQVSSMRKVLVRSAQEK